MNEEEKKKIYYPKISRIQNKSCFLEIESENNEEEEENINKKIINFENKIKINLKQNSSSNSYEEISLFISNISNSFEIIDQNIYNIEEEDNNDVIIIKSNKTVSIPNPKEIK